MSKRRTLSRRGFISAGTLAGASIAFPTSVSARASQRLGSEVASPIRLGLASYTFRNFGRVQLISFMKQLDVRDLNVKDVKDHLPMVPVEEARALADYAAAGIRLHAAGTMSFDKNEDSDIRKKFEYCKRAGIAVVVAGGSTHDNLPRIERFVKEFDIRIAIHNHGPEDKLWPSPLDVLKAVKELDSRIGCCIDVGHAARAGTDVVQAIHAAGQRLFNLHIKDLASFNQQDSQVAVGDGVMPLRQIFEALIAISYQGSVDLEYEIHPDDPMPGVIGSFAFMRGVLAGMGYARHV